jgi:hypothetical protein
MKKILLLAIVLILSSCAAGLTGSMSDSASLSSNNFIYAKRNIQGKSQATYVFGFGGMKRDAIVAEARENMLTNTTLKNNQAIANLSVDFKKSTFFGIVNTIKCFVSADIVEFK